VISRPSATASAVGDVARWGPDENPPRISATLSRISSKGTATFSLWPTLYLWSFPESDDLADSRLTAWAWDLPWVRADRFCVASEDAYSQMPLAQSLGEPAAHHDRSVSADELAPPHGLAAAGATCRLRSSRWGCSNTWARRRLSRTSVEEMHARYPRSVDHIYAVKTVKRPGTDGIAVHLQVSHIFDRHGRRGFGRSGKPRRSHAILLEAKDSSAATNPRATA